MAQDEKAALWVGWTRDALAKYDAADDIEDADELANDMMECATKYADAMLEKYEELFSGGPRRARKKKDDDDDED
jgi:hypothetical protein